MKNFLTPITLCYGTVCSLVTVPWIDHVNELSPSQVAMVLTQSDGRFEAGLHVWSGGQLTLALTFEQICTLTGRGYQLRVIAGATASQTFDPSVLIFRNGFPIAGDTITASTTQVWTVAHDPSVTIPVSIQDQLDEKAPIANPTFTGVVNGITKTMVGLSNVNNTSDLDKPVSNATATQLNLKVDKVEGKGLSTEDFSSAEQTKLSGIAAGATANQTDAFLLSRVNHTGFQAMDTITALTASLHGRQTASTALISGGVVTINPSLTSVDISAGSALFADYTDPKAPLGTQIDFGPTSSVSLVNIGAAPATYLGINSSGVIVQQTTPFTATQRRSIVPLGLAVHSNNTTVNVINSLGASGRAALNQLQDLMEAMGALNLSGNEYKPQSGLHIWRSAGSIFKYGSNFPANPLDPHQVNLASETPVTFRYRLQNSAEFANTTSIDPNNYDLNGILTAVGNNRWTIQHIILFQSGLTRIQYGQATYANYSDAVRGLSVEPFIAEPNIAANGLARALLIIQKGATNLTDPAQAVFVGVSKFGSLFTAGL